MNILNLEITEIENAPAITFEIDGVETCEWLNIGENDEGLFYYVERTDSNLKHNFSTEHDITEIHDALSAILIGVEVPVLAQINACTCLSDLVTVLNGYTKENLGDECDLCSLPTFGEDVPEPKNTMEVFSWDDTEVLIYDGNGSWSTADRCEECHEADFSCTC